MNKTFVKYRNFNGEEIEAPNVLVVYRKMKSHRCKCHHCRLDDNGICTFGRCRHEQTHHFKEMTLI